MKLGLNTRIYQLQSKEIHPFPDGVEYLRAYGVDFKKSKDGNGLLKKPDEARISDFVGFVKKYNLKVIWVPQVTKDGRNISEEITFINELKQRGVVFHAFQVLGEMYLPKYYYGKLESKGVIEKIRKEDLPSMLEIWVNALEDEYPDEKLFITCASHQNGTSRSEVYRKEYTETIMKWATNSGYDGEYCFHFYSGYKAQEGGDEEAVFTTTDFTPIINQIKAAIPSAKIHLCEGGYYRKDDSELGKMTEFYETASEQLDGGIVCLHLLQGGGEFAWYDGKGITNVGETFRQFIEEKEEPTIPLEPTLRFTVPDAYNEWVFHGVTTLYFTHNVKVKVVTRFGRRPFGNKDAGKTYSEIMASYYSNK